MKKKNLVINTTKKQGEQWPKQFNSVQFFAYFYIAEYNYCRPFENLSTESTAYKTLFAKQVFVNFESLLVSNTYCVQ